MNHLAICREGLTDTQTPYVETTLDVHDVVIQFAADRCVVREITPADVELALTSIEITVVPGTTKRFEIRFAAESGEFLLIRRLPNE